MLPSVSDNTFQEKVLNSKTPVLVKFTADWCQPCKVMSETLRDLTPELGSHVYFVEMDIESSPQATNTYGVRGLPTIMLFKNGNPLASMSGNFQKPKVRSWIIDQLGL